MYRRPGDLKHRPILETKPKEHTGRAVPSRDNSISRALEASDVTLTTGREPTRLFAQRPKKRALDLGIEQVAEILSSGGRVCAGKLVEAVSEQEERAILSTDPEILEAFTEDQEIARDFLRRSTRHLAEREV